MLKTIERYKGKLVMNNPEADDIQVRERYKEKQELELEI